MKQTKKDKEFDKVTIGPWSISPELGSISFKNENELYLEPRLAKLFSVLYENINNTVTRRHLINQIWFDTIVNEESLTRAISDLRRVLKKNFSHPPQIRTIPKRGYKMVISTSQDRKSFPTVIKYFLYTLITFTIIILVIRGLNY